MGKRTKKQKLAQQAKEREARKRIRDAGTHQTTLYMDRSTSSGSQDAFQTLGCTAQAPKTNLLLRERATGTPILMRISSPSLPKHKQANKSAGEGLQHFQTLQSNISSRITRGSFELGIFHSQGNSYLGFTKDSKGKHREQAARLLKWARDHSAKFLLSTKKILPEEWRLDVVAREKSKFLTTFFGRQAELLSPWWTATTFFEGFTGEAHTDNQDHPPSFLFNFGAPCLLVLHEYNIKVQLDHLDIAVFATYTKHSTEKVVGQDGHRWAFSAYYRERILKNKGPSQLSEDILDAVLNYNQSNMTCT